MHVVEFEEMIKKGGPPTIDVNYGFILSGPWKPRAIYIFFYSDFFLS